MDRDVQTPVHFPLPEVSLEDRQYLMRCWSSGHLERYLLRWQHASVPKVPEAFWAYPWRGCDVGCGMGRYVLDQSRRHPERAYLGIDKGSRRSGVFGRRAECSDLPNSFVLHANATPVLAQLEPGCLDAVTVFYPNPWWPRKHRQKRWPYHPLFAKFIEVLKDGGSLTMCSNEAFYLSEWKVALEHHPAAQEMHLTFVGEVPLDSRRTHFEAKFLGSGIACGQITAVKRASEVVDRSDSESAAPH